MSSRPTVTRKLVTRAAGEIAAEIAFVSAETIAKAYSPAFDGYQLARQLERFYNVVDLTMSDVEALDRVSLLVDAELRREELKWVKAHNIQPKLKAGDVVEQGTIAGVCEYAAARYLVKEPGCTQEGRFLLVKFEDAEDGVVIHG